MALETFVKVGKVNNLSDARYCAGMGVDVIGFNLVPGTKNYIAPEKYKEITEWLAGVDFAGEFEGLSAPEILEQIKHFNIQYLQISDASLIEPLSKQGIPLIFKMDMDKFHDVTEASPILEQHKEQVKYFLFESELDGYEQLQQAEIIELAKSYPIILGYGVNAENVKELIEQADIKGIALLGEEEIRVGYKDFEKLAEVLEIIEVDEYRE